MKKTILLSAFLLYSIFSFGANRTWDGDGGDNLWETASNWSGNQVPGPTDNAIFDAVTVTVSGTPPTRVQRLQIKGGADVTLDLDLNINDGTLGFHSIQYMTGGGTLTIAIGNTININTTTAKNGIFFQNAPAMLVNNGNINIAQSADAIKVDLGSFTNNGAIVITDPNSSRAIYLKSGASFTNNGSIDISGVKSGNDGLYIDEDLTNTGTITIDATSGDDCIHLKGGTFQNDGTITVNAQGTAGNNGFEIKTGAKLINNNSINADGGGTSGRAIVVDAGGELENTGTITATGGNASRRIATSGTFSNAKGATIEFGSGKIYVDGGTFTNNGLLKSDWANGLNLNSGSATNNGFYDWSTSEFDTDNGVSLTDGNGEVTASGCDVDIAEVDYHWDEDDPLNGSTGWDAAADGTFTIGTKEVKNYPPTVITDEYGTDVQIKIRELCVTAIPIELLKFTAKPTKSSILLSWTTLTEANTDYFSIEKSKDAKFFEEIGTVKAAGNSRKQLEYSLEDTGDLAGVNYYRLVTYDLDGNYKLSEVLRVSRSNLEQFTVYPTRLNKGELLNINIENSTTDAILSIYNSTGVLVYSTKISEGGKKIITIDDKFSQGIYYVKLLHINEVDIKKFFIIDN